MRPERKDYSGKCSLCRGVGGMTSKVRRGGWSGSNETVVISCGTCNGSGEIFDSEKYIQALENFIDHNPVKFPPGKQGKLWPEDGDKDIPLLGEHDPARNEPEKSSAS